jgi:hypothetical protein
LFKPEFIRTLPKPTAAFNVNRKILSIENPVAVFNNQSVYADNFIWNFDDGSVSYLKSPTHRYENVGFRRVLLEAINEFGCSDTISVIVTIPLNKIYAPNAFSPNALNADDREFFPYCFGVMKRGYHLKIVTRWNEIIYEVKNEWKGWDGRMPDGSLALAGNYVWILYFEDFMGEYHYQSGTVLLMY